MKTIDLKTLGPDLRIIRLEKGIFASSVYNKMGISKKKFRKMERGENEPKLSELVSWLLCLGLKPVITFEKL